MGVWLSLIVLTVSARGASSVSLAWSANSEPNLGGYRIHYGTATHSYTEHTDVGNVTTAVLNNLTDSTTYFIVLTAYNTAGIESQPSNEISYTTASVGPTPTPTPGPSPTPTPDASPTPTPDASPTPTPDTSPTPTPDTSPTPTPGASPTPTPLTGLTFESTQGVITPPFVKNTDNTISQSIESDDPLNGGKAVYAFTITNPGPYVVSINVKAPDTAANSVFATIDGEPVAPTMIWDIPVTSGLQSKTITWRGTGGISPKVWSLSAGIHQLVLRGREANTKLGQITVSRSAGAPSPTPTPTPLAGLTFGSTQGAITPPFASNTDNTISQTIETSNPINGGKAVYAFTITNPGPYIVSINVKAPNTSANSVFATIDGEPVAPTMIWDTPVTSGLQSETITWRGTGGMKPKVWSLSAGIHQLVLRGREANTKLGQITVSRYAGAPSPTPTPGPTATPHSSATPHPSATPNPYATPNPTASPTHTPAPTPPESRPSSPTPTPASAARQSLLNVSTRTFVQNGESVMIGGFIITGNKAKKVVVRGLGPSLAKAGIAGAMADPTLQLYNSKGVLIGSNDNWTTRRNEIQATGIPPADSRESAIVTALQPGNYTCVLQNKTGVSGVGLFDLYDLDAASSRLANISTRAKVGLGENVVIGGFIIGGDQPTKVIIRAIGPSLTKSGVSNALQDPKLELHGPTGSLIFANDNWRSAQQQQIMATTIPPTDNREAAIVTTLKPGNYTAIVRGAGNATGIALVEVYNLNK